MSAKAHNTIGTILKFGTTANNLAELCKIKSTPQLNGEREQIESTDLTDIRKLSATSSSNACRITPLITGNSLEMNEPRTISSQASKDEGSTTIPKGSTLKRVEMGSILLGW